MCRAQENAPTAPSTQPAFFSFCFHTRLFLQSERSRINVLVHSDHTPKLCPCSSPTNSCLITLRPRGHIPVRLHPQEDKPREKSLQALEVGLGLFGQSIPKYWVSGACSRTQAMWFGRECFFGPMSSVRDFGRLSLTPIMNRIIKAIRRGFIQCPIL